MNPLLAPGRKAYRVEPGTQLLLGHQFALCRGVFRRQRTIRATEPPRPFRALVAFGDDDLAGADARPARSSCSRWTKVAKVSVAVPHAPPALRRAARTCADGSSGRVEVVTEAKELMTRLVRVHFAADRRRQRGRWSCACVGIPQLILGQTDAARRLNGKRMDEEGVGDLPRRRGGRDRSSS